MEKPKTGNNSNGKTAPSQQQNSNGLPPVESTKSLLKQYGARVKSIYLELKNYRYYHSPSKQMSPDKRFVGRGEMKKKLKSLITKSETNSGTYLVTGFRGMGKTSLVNMVLSDLLNQARIAYIGKVIFSYFLIVWIATFFNARAVFAVSLIGVAVFIAMFYSFKKLEVKSNFQNHFKKFIDFLFSPFENENENRAKKIFAVGFIRVGIVLLVSNFFLLGVLVYQSIQVGEIVKIGYSSKFWAYFAGLIVYFIGVWGTVVKKKNKKKKQNHEEKEKEEKPRHKKNRIRITLILVVIFAYVVIALNVEERFITILPGLLIILVLGVIYLWFDTKKTKEIIHSFVNHSNIIPIRINLGKESLSEQDILRLVTYGLYNSYKEIAKPFGYFKRKLWSLVLGILIYLIGSAFYYYEPTYKLVNDWRARSNIVDYYPSQSHFVKWGKISDSLTLDNFKNIEDTSSMNMSFLADYYSKIDVRDDDFESRKNVAILGESNPTFTGKLLAVTTTIDYLILKVYVNTITPFSRFSKSQSSERYSYFLSNTLNLHPNFRFFPRYDYLFLIYIFVFILGSKWVLRWRIWGVSHHSILKKLSNLVDSLEAAVDVDLEKSIGLNYLKNSLGLKFNRRKSYPIKSAPEIEIALIEILREIEAVQKLRMRPRFVFIFDELDKIQPRDLNEKDSGNSPKDYSESEWTKKRQDTIGTILANLKHFFNSAKAKFIFIAGREMYDAALADISDRDALIGSLFHEVIYVHSFYKDPADERLSNITSMTERYICKFLIPEEHLDEDPNLHKYNKYLSDHEVELFEGELDKKLARAKIIMSLHNFISYVSYRSNGAPKKITKIFEEYVKGFPDRKTDYDSTIITRKHEGSLYLHFSFNDQYIFSVGRYLFNPFVIAVNKYIKAFEDKLLVSTSFLLNHIYKFHKVGFAHKTLELTPEIIAIYKAPELRDFINRLITFLSQTHLRKIISGLYDFKFYSRIEKEIAYISKISESESAAFNFTLDESLIIKSIFRNKLNKVREYWDSDSELMVHIESVGFINNNLGDLSFNDAKYFDAIHYYKEALIGIDASEYLKLTPDVIIFLIRTELKLGLAYEMIKNTDEALMIYDEIGRKAIEYIQNKDKSPNDENKSEDQNNTQLITILRLFYQPLLAKMQLIEKSTIKSLTQTQLRENLKSFKHIINTYLRPEQRFLLRAEYYDKIGDLLFYKNGISFGEFKKGEEAGETDTKFLKEIQWAKSNREYYYSLPVDAYYRYMVSLTSLIHVGISESFVKGKKIHYFDITKPHESDWLIIHYFTSFLFNSIGKAFPISRKSFYLAAGNSLSDAGNTILSIISAEINNNSIDIRLLDVNKLRRVLSFKMKGDDDKERLTFEDENQIAALMPNDNNKQEAIYLLRERVNKFYEEFELGRLHTALRYLYIAAIYFEKAGDYKGYVFQLTKIIHVLRLVVLKVKQSNDGKLPIEPQPFLDFLNERILYKAIRYNYKAYKNYDHSEAQQLKNSLGLNDNGPAQEMELEKAIRASTSAAEDIKEILLIYADIKLKLFPVKKLKLEDGLINPYTNVSLRGNRLSQLNYKSHFNYKYLKKLIEEDNSETTPDEDAVQSEALGQKEKAIEWKEKGKDMKEEKAIDGKEKDAEDKNSDNKIEIKSIIDKDEAKKIIAGVLNRFSEGSFEEKDKLELEFIILDSIFILYEMRLTIEIFGQSYIHNHSWYASIYRRLGFWSMLYHEYIEGVKSREVGGQSANGNENQDDAEPAKIFEKGHSKELEEVLKKMIGQEEFTDLDPISFYEKALKHCYSIYETHSEGQAYQDFIQEMNYLDDDFNDNLYHFSATMERMRINFDMVENHIKKLSKVAKQNQKRFHFESYFTHLEEVEEN